MKNLQQIELVNYALNKEREKLLFEIINLNTAIKKKMALIKKMFEYQKEYSNSNYLNISRAIPALYKNLDSFSARLKDIVIKEENEIKNLVATRDIKINKVLVIDQKMKVMDQFSVNVKHEQMQRREKIEQLNMDDLASIKQTRGEHE